MKMRDVAAVSAILALLASAPAQADVLSDFYTGKTITVIVGADSGGGYDAQGRLVR